MRNRQTGMIPVKPVCRILRISLSALPNFSFGTPDTAPRQKFSSCFGGFSVKKMPGGRVHSCCGRDFFHVLGFSAYIFVDITRSYTY